MAIESTLLTREINSIIENGNGVKRSSVSLRIKTPDQWIDPFRVTLLSMERDYEDSYGDVMVVELTVGLGDFTFLVVPNKDNLFIDVTQEKIHWVASPSDGKKRITRRYRAILMDTGNPGLTLSSGRASTIEALNSNGTKSIQFQLIDEGLYQVRMTTIGRLYRASTTMKVMQSLLAETRSLVDSTQQQAIFGINTVPGFNETTLGQIILPHGIPLVSVKDYLQEKHGGIYAAGAGCYLQEGYWYLYPLYDIKRYQRTPKSLTVLGVAQNQYGAGDRTYRETNNQIVVIAASNKNTADDALNQQLNTGNAYRFTQVDNLLNYATTEGNVTSVERNKNVFEVQGAKLKSGKTNAKWYQGQSTANAFKIYSEMARKNGRYLTVQWLHGDITRLYPGMPVKYMGMQKGRLEIVYGVLLGVQEQKIPDSGGVGVSTFATAVKLKLFLNRTAESK